MSIIITDEKGVVVEENLKQFKKQNSLISTIAKIRVPMSLMLLIDYMTRYVGGDEYALVYNAKRIEETLTWEIDPKDVVIPNQKVSTANVELDNYEEVRGYNGVVHRHPSGCKSFSKTDETTLNSLFSVSFIYIPSMTTPDAIVNINVDSVAKIQVKAECEVVNDLGDIIFHVSNEGKFIPDEDYMEAKLTELYPEIMGNDLGKTYIKARVKKAVVTTFPRATGAKPSYWGGKPNYLSEGKKAQNQAIKAATQKVHQKQLLDPLGFGLIEDEDDDLTEDEMWDLLALNDMRLNGLI